MVTLFKTKSSPTLKRLRELFAAEDTERAMRTAARWAPQLAEALTLYGRTLEDVRRVHGIIYGATEKSDRALWQLGIVMKRRTDKETRGVVAPENCWKVIGQSGARDLYVTALHEHGLKVEDSYLAAVFELARPGAGISEADAVHRADEATATAARLLKEIESWESSEVVMRILTMPDNKKVQAAFYSFSPDIACGDVPTLLEWARQHPEAVN